MRRTSGTALPALPEADDGPDALALTFDEDDETGAVRRERDSAVANWLVSTVRDPHQAWEDWARMDTALFPCCLLFTAVRIPASLVWAAAGSEEPETVGEFLSGFFTGGAVVMDRRAHVYYALVPPSAAWPPVDGPDCVECLDRSYYLGLPPVHRTDPGGRSYWCVPMEAPGSLCDADRVAELVRLGRVATAPDEDEA